MTTVFNVLYSTVCIHYSKLGEVMHLEAPFILQISSGCPSISCTNESEVIDYMSRGSPVSSHTFRSIPVEGSDAPRCPPAVACVGRHCAGSCSGLLCQPIFLITASCPCSSLQAPSYQSRNVASLYFQSRAETTFYN